MLNNDDECFNDRYARIFFLKLIPKVLQILIMVIVILIHLDNKDDNM